MNKHVRTWPLQEAKAKFSELVRLAHSEGPQMVTVHGQQSVLITKAPGKLAEKSNLTGADFVAALTAGPPIDFELPPRPVYVPEDGFAFDDFTSDDDENKS